MFTAPSLPGILAQDRATISPPRAVAARRHSPATEPTSRDELALSPWGALAADTDLDLAASWVRTTTSGLAFNLTFGASTTQRVTAHGIYAAESRELELTLRFDLPRPAEGDGPTAGTLQVELRLRASVNRSRSVERFEQKEDIVSLVRRVANAMLEVARSDNQRLAGVVFDADDLAELAALDGGRTLMTLVQLIQQIIDYSYRLKALHADGPNERVEDVILTPQRRITQGLKTEYNETRLTDVALEIRQVAPPDPTDAPTAA